MDFARNRLRWLERSIKLNVATIVVKVEYMGCLTTLGDIFKFGRLLIWDSSDCWSCNWYNSWCASRTLLILCFLVLLRSILFLIINFLVFFRSVFLVFFRFLVIFTFITTFRLGLFLDHNRLLSLLFQYVGDILYAFDSLQECSLRRVAFMVLVNFFGQSRNLNLMLQRLFHHLLKSFLVKSIDNITYYFTGLRLSALFFRFWTRFLVKLFDSLHYFICLFFTAVKLQLSILLGGFWNNSSRLSIDAMIPFSLFKQVFHRILHWRSRNLFGLL